jgi:hypothetical protein
MGFLQTTIWNNVFKYAYPISFLGSMAYGVLSILQVDPSQIIANKNIVMAFNVFVGVCGLFAFASWFNTDIDGVSSITKYIDLDANVTKSQIASKA